MGALRSIAARNRVPALILGTIAVLAAGVLLTLLMHNADTYSTGLWDDQSQDLVFGRMLQMQQGQSTPGGFMGAYRITGETAENRYLFRENAAPDPAAFSAYTDQSGLQGTALGIVNKVLGMFQPDGESRERILYGLNSTLFYAVTLCLCGFVASVWGVGPALAWLAAVLLSPWLQRGMKDLYWCLWLWWLPALAGLALCALTRRRGRTPPWAFALPFAAVLVRCLCGFEFISDYLVLSEIPLVFCWARCLCSGRPARVWVGRMAGTGLAGLGGMAGALGAWLVQGRLFFGSWSASAAHMGWIIGLRNSLSDDGIAVVTVPQVLRTYLLDDTTPLLQLGGFGVRLPVLAGTCLAALALAAAVLALRDRAALKELLPPLCVWVLSFLAPLSWLVLSKAHSAAHPHIIPMLWHFAFVPVSCALLVLLAKTLWRALRPAHTN